MQIRNKRPGGLFVATFSVAALLACNLAATCAVSLRTRVNEKDSLEYVWIQPGKFIMGCSAADTQCEESEKPAHEVEISKGFWMGQTVVTVAAWKKYRAEGKGPMLPTEDGIGRTNLNEASKDGNMPVVFVSWVEARDFCKWSGGRRWRKKRRRVDPETALLSHQTMQKGQIGSRFPEETRRIAVPRASRGIVRQGLVATVAAPSLSSGHVR